MVIKSSTTYPPEAAVRAKFHRTVRTTGIALTLALSAGIVLGASPASAETTSIKTMLRYHGDRFPSMSAAQDETRPAADAACFKRYGYRAREIKPSSFYGLQAKGGTNWYQFWTCYSN
jgi:hypothetical protein